MLVAATVAAALALAYPSSTRQFTWPWILLLQLAWFAPLVALALEVVRVRPWHLPARPLLAGLALLAGGTLVSAAMSPFSAASLPRVWPTLGGVAALLWLHDWLGHPTQAAARRRLLLHGLAGGAALLVVASLAGWAGRPGGFSWAVRNDFPFGHSIQLAGALLLFLPWSLAAAWIDRGGRRLAWLAVSALGGAMLLATSSRSAVLALGTVAIAGAAWGLLRGRWSPRAKFGFVLASAGLLAAATLVNPRLRELVRQGAWSDAARESNTQRAAMLQAGWLMGAARPATGWGPGTVPLAYPGLRHRLAGGVDNVLQLHNTPAQLWACLGLPGAVAFLLLATAAAGRLLALWRHEAPPVTAVAAAAAVFGYGLFALTDHQLDLPVLSAGLVASVALLLSDDRNAWTGRPSRSARWALAAAGLVAVLLSLRSTGRDLLARLHYDRAVAHLAAGRTDAARAELTSAAQRAPHDPYYRHQLAAVLLRPIGSASPTAPRAPRVAGAHAELSASLAAGVFTEYARFNLGWLALERADAREAAGHFRAALHEAPHRRGAYFGLGLALRNLGPPHAQDAIRAFALEWLNDPAAGVAPLWGWPEFASLRPAVLAEASRLLADAAPAHPATSFVRELWSWWALGGAVPATGHDGESTAFAATLQAVADGAPNPVAASGFAWGRLLRAWSSPDPAAAFHALLPRRPEAAAALARRALRCRPPDVRGFLVSGPDTEDALLATEVPARTGYGVLALHPDGPVLTDLYVRQQDRVVSEFASTLFPPKGWIPAAVLLERLPPAP